MPVWLHGWAYIKDGECIRIRGGKKFAHQIQLRQPIENNTFQKGRRWSKKIHYAQQQMDFQNNSHLVKWVMYWIQMEKSGNWEKCWNGTDQTLKERVKMPAKYRFLEPIHRTRTMHSGHLASILLELKPSLI